MVKLRSGVPLGDMFNHRLLSLFLIFSLVVLPYANGSGSAAQQVSPAGQVDGELAVPGGVLLRLQPGVTPPAAEELLLDWGLEVIAHLPQIDVWHVSGRQESDAQVLAALASRPEVTWAEPNDLVRITLEPNDSFYRSQQVNLRVIRLPQAWDLTTGGALLVAVIDTGIDLDHPDLGARLWLNLGELPGNGLDDDLNGFVDDHQGWDFVNDDALPQDDQGHGSHVAGIAGAATDNGIGIAGVSWGAILMAVKALDRLGNGAWDDVSAAILYAADNGARVLNLSFGGETPSQTIAAAIAYAQGRGCLVIASAGNGGGPVFYPAALPGVLAVAATDNADLPAPFSNRGPQVDVSAPGVGILAPNASSSYAQLSGTSQAAAHASGLAALLWSARPELAAAQVSQVITSTARDVWSPGFDQLTGWGRIDAYAAASTTVIRLIYLPFVRSNLWSFHLPLIQAGYAGE